MIVLQKYIFKKLFTTFLGGISLFIILFIFVKFSEQISTFIRVAPQTTWKEYILYFVYEIPFASVYLLPMSTMFAVVYVLGKLNEDNELYIFTTTGRSIWFFMLPFILVIFLFCTLISIFNEEILYLPHQKHRALHKKFRNQAYNQDQDRENIVQFGKDNKLYVVDFYSALDKSLNQVKIFYLDAENRFKKIIQADKITFKEGTHWTIGAFREYELEKKKISYQQKKTQDINLGDKLFYFRKVFGSPEDLSTRQILEEIDKVETIGGNKDSLLTDYHVKIAAPYIALIIIFLGIPLSTFSRYSVIIVSFFLVIVTAFVYLVFFNVGVSLGRAGVLSPFIAGWLGNIVFALAAFFLSFFIRS